MAQRGAPDGRDSLSNPPSVVHVTVEAGPRRRSAVPGARRIRALLVVGLGVAGVLVGGVLAVSGGGVAGKRAPAPASMREVQAGPRLRGTAQVAAVTEAYRFPLGCMGMTLSRRGLADALASRTGPCWRYGVFVTAVLRRVGGVWQLGLEATSRSCPRIALPASIRAELAECRR